MSQNQDPQAFARALADASGIVRGADIEPGARFTIPEKVLIEIAGNIIAESREAGARVAGTLADQAKGLADLNRIVRAIQGETTTRQAKPDFATVITRAIVCLIRAHASADVGRDDRFIGSVAEDQAKQLYSTQPIVGRALRELVERAATDPASTTGWGAIWTQPKNAGFLPAIAPTSVYARLAPRGLRVDLSGISSLRMPTRGSGNLAGDFVGEGMPIPVRKMGLALTSLGPVKKLAVISDFSVELAERSVPTIEAVVRSAMESDTGELLDARLLDNVAATPIRPAGLLNGVVPLTATAGGGLAALSGDLGQLATAIPGASDLVILMTPSDRTRALVLAPGLLAVPILEAPLPAKTIVALDAADFATAEGDAPRFSVSENAAIHEEDTTPLPLSTVGAPATVASPMRSFWQTDSIGLRLLAFVSWAMRRVDRIATVTSVTW